MAKQKAKIGDLKVGEYIVVNGDPCVITKKTSSSTKSSDPKKEKVYVEGLFDGQKRTMVKNLDDEVTVPEVESKNAQIVAIIRDSAQLMDLSTYETFELPIPLELRGEVEEGDEVEYVESLNRKKIVDKRSF